MYLAHLKWFEHAESVAPVAITGVQWLVSLAIVLGGAAFFVLVDKRAKGLNLAIAERLAAKRPFVPSVVGATIGLSLVIFSLQGQLFAPNLPVDNTGLLAAEFILGVLLTLGLATRYSAIGLLLLYAASGLYGPPLGLFEHLEYAGAAVFLIIVGSGAWSLDALLRSAQAPLKKYQSYALPAWCFLTGLSLAVLAFTEKLFNLALAEKFLQTHHWNLLAVFGVSDLWFIIFAGSMELLFGVLLALRIGTRLVAAMLAGLMGLTALLLGPTEVAGHLFIIGLGVAIWVGDEKLGASSRAKKA